jgi:ADP-ribose pyrophosphatase YjhB (NUDIX family)
MFIENRHQEKEIRTGFSCRRRGTPLSKEQAKSPFGAPMRHLTIEQLIGLASVHTTNDISYLPQPNQVSVVISDMIAPPDINPTAFVLPFTADGDVVLTDNVKRGAEACGGHRDPILAEDGVTVIRMETAAEAAERESAEEAGVILKSIEPLGIFRSITGAEKPDGYRYPYPWSTQQFFMGIVERFDLSLVKRDECHGPVTVKPQDAERILKEREFILYKHAMATLFPALAAEHGFIENAETPHP